MKRTIAIVTLAVVGLMTAGPAIAQQRPQSSVALRGQRQAQPQGQRQAPPARPMYQRRDTWYEFLLKQFNPSNFDYGAWIEERRQVFLDASVRNPYFKYSSGRDDCAAVDGHAVHQAMDRPPARHVDYGGDDDGPVQPRSLLAGCR